MIFPKDRKVLMAILGAHGRFSAAPALEGGADFLQVRAGDLPSRDLVALTRAVILACGAADRVIVNSRPDIAELTGAFGVHLKESGLPVAAVRRHFPGLVVGVSRHDRPGLLRAVEEGADYAIFGPVFDTPGKESRALGLDRFASVVAGIPIPVIAVGGLAPENAASAAALGAAGVAAIRPFEGLDAARRAAEFRRALDRATP